MADATLLAWRRVLVHDRWKDPLCVCVARRIAPVAPRHRIARPSARRAAVRTGAASIKESAMWYFTWILGVGVALAFGIINVLWLETNGKFARDPQVTDTPTPPPGDKPA
jgi:cytochrome bd-I ubiquinol oxidase subunit X